MNARVLTMAAIFAVVRFPGGATPASGVTAQVFRNPIVSNVYATQWGPSPLFNLILQSSGDASGYDLAQIVNTFAPADATGTPSQSGWHDHPAPVGFVQITQGALWVQEKAEPGCLTYYPAGSILIEGQGHMHNAFNFDQKTPAVLRAVWFVERNIPATRTDQPD